MTDLLAPLLADANRGDVLVGNGQTAAGLRVYAGRNGGSWVADEMRTADGAAQNGNVPHLRTGDAKGRVGRARYHRTHTWRHYLAPRVDMSFTVVSRDHSHPNPDNLGVKVGLEHQDNLSVTWCQLKTGGTVSLFREARDGAHADRGPYGYTLGKGGWDNRYGVRRHVRIDQRRDGSWAVDVDGVRVLTAPKGVDTLGPVPGGLALRMDGVDVRLHSLLVDDVLEAA